MTSANDVDVWHIPLHNEPDRAQLASLDTHEHARLRRLRFARDRRRYAAAHAATRAILSRYLDVGPGHLRFSRNANGKPVLADPRRHLDFNLTHSGDRALLAVTHGRPVGVDLEEVRADQHDAQIARRFAAAESARLARMSAADRAARFTLLWTRKEALAKAFGGSILHLLGVAVDDGATSDHGVVVTATDVLPGPHRVRDLRLADRGYRGAIALWGAAAFTVHSHEFEGAASW